jgi:hypothetical protein
VLVDLPIPDRFNAYDFQYIYFSTFHHRRVLNGASGFIPPDYANLVIASQDFPAGTSLEVLRARGAQYAVLHADYYEPDVFTRIVAALGSRADVAFVAARPSPNGREDRLYRLQ